MRADTEAWERKKAQVKRYLRHYTHVRRAAYADTDLTAADIRAILGSRTYCPLCRKRMKVKHLDHIIPINQGGTHTRGNVRVLCSTCNLRRPKDGSDWHGQSTLWSVA